MEKTFLTLGIVCIVAAIVGGGFKGLGIEIPVIKTVRRQTMLAATGALLIGTDQVVRWRDSRPVLDSNELTRSGLEAYDARDFRVAAQKLRRAAELGDAEAQYHYGEMLYHGEGVVPDKAVGAEWIRKSAQQGFPAGEASLALVSLEQASPDTLTARVWAERSAAQNDPVGLYILAQVASDSTQQVELFHRAAKLGHAPSQLALGLLSMRAAGEAKRVMGAVDGIEWIKRAASQGDGTAELYMAKSAASLGPGSLKAAYVWWLLAQRPHVRPFEVLPEIRSHSSDLGKRLEAELSVDAMLEARRQAADEPVWQPKLERAYRHGH